MEYRTGICLECGNTVTEEYHHEKDRDSFGSCATYKGGCGNDGWILDGIMIPWHRRNTLCCLYYNVKELDCRQYSKGDKVELTYTAGRKKDSVITGEVEYSMYFGGESRYDIEQALVIKVEDNKYIYVTDTESVEDAYDALFGCNRKVMWRWKHRIMTIDKVK